MNSRPLRILVLEDSEADYRLLHRMLKKEFPDHECRRVDTDPDLVAALNERWDIVLSDYSIPGMDFLSSLETLRKRLPAVPVILVSGSIGEEHAVSLIKKGVWDFILKQNLTRLVPAVRHALQEAEEHTARTQVEGALRESEEKLKWQAALLDIATDAILVMELDGRILYWNKGAERIYGWTEAEACCRNVSELLFSEDCAAEADEACKATLEKRVWNGDLHQRTRDGKELIVEGRWTLMPDERGKPKRIMSVNSDVTAQRSVQAQLLRSQRLESLGTLAGSIAHDLNNVLSPIMMGAEGLTILDQDDSMRNILALIRTSAQRGANIVRQILNFARGMEGIHGLVQVKHVLYEIEAMIRETFPASIRLQTEIPADLWPISGDVTQLHQVIMNLCLNARDAMPNGGELSLTASNVQLDEAYARMNIEARPVKYVVLKVEDTGCGIQPDIIEKIFDPFFTTKGPEKGTGLGLSTARSIVKSHGGFITVYSVPDTGTVFRVYIPAEERLMEDKAKDETAGIPMGNGELILIAEDELSLRDLTGQILEGYGYRVITAADGTGAVARYVENKAEISLVITDMMMPYMDGAATIRAIRTVNPEARILVTSGLMIGEYAQEVRGFGAVEFLAKPYTAETLLRTLRDVLQRS